MSATKEYFSLETFLSVAAALLLAGALLIMFKGKIETVGKNFIGE